MQRTRLNTLVTIAGGTIELLFSNSWRKIALSIISILMGFFMSVAIVTTSGQFAIWDIGGAAAFLFFTEITSLLVYRHQQPTSARIGDSLLLTTLNLFKIGVTYSLFFEAFKSAS